MKVGAIVDNNGTMECHVVSIYYISNDDELFNAVNEVIKEKIEGAILLDLYRSVGYISVYHDRTRDEDCTLAQEIIRIVARTLALNVDTILGNYRRRDYVEARNIMAYLINVNTLLPLQMIGKMMGGRHHSTIIHYLKRYRDLYDGDEEFRMKVMEVEMEIKLMPISELVHF